MVTKDWQTHSFSFVAPKDLDCAEIQFTRFPAGLYEIDDLSFKTGGEFIMPKGRAEEGQLPIVAARAFAPVQMRRDFYQFLVDTEHKYWTGMQKWLQKDLGLKAPVSGTQLNYSPPHLQAELDYVDHHGYWNHPNVCKDWTVKNVAMVNHQQNTVSGMASQRVAGKPFTVSEYNNSYPMFYGAEGQPMLRAYGALNGWDGVFEYSYNNRQNAEPNFNEYFFSMAARTDVLAHFPACAAIFLRADVKESENELVVSAPYDEMFENLVAQRHPSYSAANASKGQVPTQASLVRKVAVDVTGKAPKIKEKIVLPKKVLVSDTKQLTWNNEIPGAGFFTVDTENTKLFTGFPKGRTFDMGGVVLKVGETKLGWATISLVSRKAQGFGENDKPTQVLLTATGLSHNNGAKFTHHGDNVISCRGEDWGKAPTVNEGIPATITMPSSAKATKCWALDEAGNRKGSVPVVATADGKALVAISPTYRTIWYEITVE